MSRPELPDWLAEFAATAEAADPDRERTRQAEPRPIRVGDTGADEPTRDEWYADDFETTTDFDGPPVPYDLDRDEYALYDTLTEGSRVLTVLYPRKGDEDSVGTRTLTVTRLADGDLAATVRTGRVRVWSWAIAELHSDRIHHGTDIARYVEKAGELGGIHWFHNLRFDGAFLDAYLQDRHPYGLGMESGQWQRRYVPRAAFGALISDTGAHYARYVHLPDGNRFEVRDSLKKFPATDIKRLSDMFGAPVAKGEIDYELERPHGYQPTADEWEYIDADVIILKTALTFAKDAGATGLTVGGDALTEYRRTMEHGKFRTIFPLLDRDTDEFIRRAYRGGWTYVNPKYQGRVLDEPGEVYDVNSMYPAVMRQSSYPYGEPVRLAPGQLELDGYPHTIYGALLDARIRPGRLPMIQVKRDARYNPVEYLTEAMAVEWFGTEVDWRLLHEQYDVTVHEWIGGVAFRGQLGLFDRYIDKWMQVKTEADRVMLAEKAAGRVGSDAYNAAAGRRAQAKFALNNLWGRFAINPLRAGRLPGISDEGTPLYTLTPQEYDEPCYTPVGVWTTSYGRDRVIRAAQSFGDRFLAADTDSCHVLGLGAAGLDVDSTRLGAWKLESEFDKATYLRAKAYAERIGGEVEAHVAGLPRKLLKSVSVEDVRIGAKFSGKLVPRRVPGGVILQSTDFEIGERDAWGHRG